MSFSQITTILPKRQLSWLCGTLAHVPLPPVLRAPVLRAFSQLVGIDESEAELPLSEYRSVGAFFSRKLRLGARQIEPAVLTCPVDGTLREIGQTSPGGKLLIKGVAYTLAELLADEEATAAAHGTQVWNVYLSPRDYHRVHAPVDGILERIIHIPGSLWPVNDWSLATIDKLFSRNERVIFVFRQEDRCTLMVMVGATNVGSIRLTDDSSFSTSRFLFGSDRRPRSFPIGKKVKRGDDVAYFTLGSSVLLFWHHLWPEHELASLIEPGSHVSMGLPLVTKD
jgi:phosphatidylserine decarboxylase